MKTLNITLLFTIAVGLLMFSSCKDNSAGSTEEEGEAEIIDSVSVDIPADSGEVGLVINAREIFRKGYTATEAEVTFPNHSRFNETLDIDSFTSVAVLSIPNEDLSEEEKSAFANGVMIDIVIYDENQMELAKYHNNEQVLDDSNIPLKLETELDYNIPPITLRTDVPYYIIPKEIRGKGTFDDGSAIEASSPRLYTFKIPDFNDPEVEFEFYFTPVGDGSGSYYIQRGDPTIGRKWYFTHNSSGTTIIDVTENEADALKFMIEQESDGWIRIREAGTDTYLYLRDGSSDPSNHDKAFVTIPNGEPADSDNRFRLINANIMWSATDQGTYFNEPVMPPAKVEFAYEATIRNCSPGTFTEQVGTEKTRESKHGVTTSESLQFSNKHVAGAELGVSAVLGGEIYGAKVTVDARVHYSYTRTNTTTNETTIDSTFAQSTQVSRLRTIEVPPFTGVEVYDAVRVVSDAHVPFTQVLRLKATYEDGPALSGDEMMTQILLNHATGIPIQVGEDYVDVGMNGEIEISEMYSTESGVEEISDACE